MDLFKYLRIPSDSTVKSASEDSLRYFTEHKEDYPKLFSYFLEVCREGRKDKDGDYSHHPDKFSMKEFLKLLESYSFSLIKLPIGIRAYIAHKVNKLLTDTILTYFLNKDINENFTSKKYWKTISFSNMSKETKKYFDPVLGGLSAADSWSEHRRLKDAGVKSSRANVIKGTAGRYGASLGGATAGALAGTAVMPVIGTAIGGLVGGVGGLVGAHAAYKKKNNKKIANHEATRNYAKLTLGGLNKLGGTLSGVGVGSGVGIAAGAAYGAYRNKKKGGSMITGALKGGAIGGVAGGTVGGFAGNKLAGKVNKVVASEIAKDKANFNKLTNSLKDLNGMNIKKHSNILPGYEVTRIFTDEMGNRHVFVRKHSWDKVTGFFQKTGDKLTSNLANKWTEQGKKIRQGAVTAMKKADPKLTSTEALKKVGSNHMLDRANWLKDSKTQKLVGGAAIGAGVLGAGYLAKKAFGKKKQQQQNQ